MAEMSNYKSQLCRYWENSFSCSKGENCSYAHGKEELRAPKGKDGSFVPRKDFEGGFPKTKPCKFFMQGSCKFGASCKFSDENIEGGNDYNDYKPSFGYNNDQRGGFRGGFRGGYNNYRGGYQNDGGAYGGEGQKFYSYPDQNQNANNE